MVVGKLDLGVEEDGRSLERRGFVSFDCSQAKTGMNSLKLPS